MAGEPREFGPYRLVRRLGVGGMAETFEAARVGASGFEQRVCLKRVLPAFGQDDDFISRFRREARLAARLRHTNIVGVVGFGQVDGSHYMALELVDGVDLRSFLKSSKGEKLPPQIVALIGFDLALALEHAHRMLVHRDISPSNILLSRTGEAKLADFGLAKAIDNTTAAASRSAKGKIPYMSPEHMRGEPVDGRADLFSLGVVLFEAAAGVRPFDGAHDVETMQKILEGDARSLTRLAPQMPSALRKAIENLIEVDLHARTPSASRLVEELAAIAPAPSVRREFATIVESHRGGPAARLHVRGRDEERDTDIGRPPVLPRPDSEAEIAAVSPATRSKIRRPAALAGLIGAMLTAALGAAWWLGQPLPRADKSQSPAAPASVPVSEPAAVPGSGSVPVSEPAAVSASATASAYATAPASAPASASATAPEPVPAPEPGSATVPATVSAPASRPAPASKGWLRVVVQPWGNVWIDDVWMGRAPVKARLTKGRHVVKAGRELPSITRTVRIQPRARKEIEINLVD
jgi:serine/threonine-protein kinase